MAKLEIKIDFEKLGEELAKYGFEKVVRCKDCRYLAIINMKPIFAICEMHAKIFYLCQEDTREYFCSWGQRRRDETD